MRRVILVGMFVALAGVGWGQGMDSTVPMGSMSMPHGAGNMSAHMKLSETRPVKPGDQEKADAIAAAAKTAIEPYVDYKKALADGFVIFMPNLPQKIYHFTSYERGIAAARRFDPTMPTSLLYEKTTDGGYKLVGAMYTDRQRAPEAELDARIPLSVARWHEHVNFCKAPAGQEKAYFGKDAKFGLLGSISTEKDCAAAGGTFQPNLFGWMVHVYPFETDRKEVWSTERDEDDGDMKGMKM
jgi:hypothetical protein